MLCAAWLNRSGADPRGIVRALPALGVLAGLFLVLYGTFLGTEGQAYRWMRRYGVIFYFGFTYLSMLIATGALWRLAGAGAFVQPARLDRWLVALCAITLIIGLAHVVAPLFVESDDLRNRLENLAEWYVGLDFTLFFAALAWLWRDARFRARLATGDS